MKEIITRKEALERNLTRYYTGKPCKNGHTAERDTGRGSCIECKKEWQNSKSGREYLKQYRSDYKKTEKGREVNLKATRDHRERRRQWLFEYKQSVSCVYCGESNPLCLDLDHVDHSTKKGTPGKMFINGTNWNDVMSELDKCQPVCRNCHNIKSIIESGKLKNQDIDQYVPDSMKHLMNYD